MSVYSYNIRVQHNNTMTSRAQLANLSNRPLYWNNYCNRRWKRVIIVKKICLGFCDFYLNVYCLLVISKYACIPERRHWPMSATYLNNRPPAKNCSIESTLKRGVRYSLEWNSCMPYPLSTLKKKNPFYRPESRPIRGRLAAILKVFYIRIITNPKKALVRPVDF